jgi:pyruvate/2-oxoglutarate dehydrogenase complex dihydrolipoamide acyltransferase (E2) component
LYLASLHVVASQVPSKKEVALKFLESSMISVFLDPRPKNVIVPLQFKSQPQLRLDVGLNMSVQIPDLQFDDEAFSCTLSFNRTPFWCVIPWPSVFAVMGEDERAVVWPDDVPPEIQQGRQKPPNERPVSAPSFRSEDAVAAKDARAPAGSRRLAAVPDLKPELKVVTQEPDQVQVVQPVRAKAKPANKKLGSTGASKVRKPDEAKAPPSLAPKPKPEKLADVTPITAAGATEASDKKRELPSYLRIIK